MAEAPCGTRLERRLQAATHHRPRPRLLLGRQMTEALPRVAIVGCGLVGQRRARAMSRAQLIACADVDRNRAEAVASLAPECIALTDWRELLARAGCDIVIVATPH